MKLEGLKINFLGDSITEGVGASSADTIYHAVLKKEAKLCEARNYGISGTRFAVQKGTPERPKDDYVDVNSFSERFDKMDDDADVVVVFGGTNDSWTENTPGEIIYEKWSEDDLRFVLPGISCFMSKLTETVPKEKIHFIINTGLREEISCGIIKICNHYGVGFTVLSDIDKKDGHPTYRGMVSIKNQVLLNI